MTYKEENIVNIAMQAATLLKDGKIERDNFDGHLGMTQAIISLADEFEQMNKDVDYDASDRDYWIEIDHFSERKLLELFGREQEDLSTTKTIIYLCPQKDHTYSAAVALNHAPAGCIPLTETHDYPVNVLYTRTDLNGSTCIEYAPCNSLPDLLSTLDWCGKCRYTIHELWTFDLEKTENHDLEDLFSDVYLHRMKLIDKEIDEICSDIGTLQSSLDGQILDAQQRAQPTTDRNISKRTNPSIDH